MINFLQFKIFFVWKYFLCLQDKRFPRLIKTRESTGIPDTREPFYALTRY